MGEFGLWTAIEGKEGTLAELGVTDAAKRAMRLGRIALVLLGISSAIGSPLNGPVAGSQPSMTDTSHRNLVAQEPSTSSSPGSSNGDGVEIPEHILVWVLQVGLPVAWFALGWYARGKKVAELERELDKSRKTTGQNAVMAWDLGQCTALRLQTLVSESVLAHRLAR